jgi:hypothetical protein
MSMTVTPITRKVAILQIFREQRADKAGMGLALEALMAVWTRVGLRGDDLSNGLNELIEDGSLSLRPGHLDPMAVLTAEGKLWLDGVGMDQNVLVEQERVLQLFRSRVGDQKNAGQNGGAPQRWRVVDRRVQLD